MKLEDMSPEVSQQMDKCLFDATCLVGDFFDEHNLFNSFTLEAFAFHWLKQVVRMRTLHNLQNEIVFDKGIDTIRGSLSEAIEVGVQEAIYISVRI